MYTSGVAVATARSKSDAIYQLCLSFLKTYRLQETISPLPRSSIGTWDQGPYQAPPTYTRCQLQVAMNIHLENPIEFVPSTYQSEFQVLKTRLQKDSRYQMFVKAHKDQWKLFKFYEELMNTDDLTIIPNGVGFGYFCGGGD
ncbi:Hypothetical protein POVR1_LOCUS420 [uncultured virus]|nr:Hypothetical protein POVR1_LOCUS420 [uncultured virus]